MIFTNNIPYTYLIGWSKLSIWYYGVRYAENCHPNELWKDNGYKTSSKYVDEFVKIHGDPDIIQIRKTFDGNDRTDKSVVWECRVLTKLNAASRSDYLNKHNGNGRASMADPAVRKAHKEKMNSPEVKQRCRNSSNTELQKKNWTDIKIRSSRITNMKKSLADPEIKKKQSDAIKKAVNTPDAKLKKHNNMVKSWKDPVVRERKIAALNKPETKEKMMGERNTTIYSFIHTTGLVEVCSQYTLRTKYNLNSGNLASVVFGRKKSCSGWRLTTNI
jgi:hypothetical protein